MPVVCLNTSAYSISEQPDMTTSSSYNASAYGNATVTPTTFGISDPGDPLVYILAVLSFYVLSITLLMAKSIHGGREEKNYDDYLQSFIKKEGSRNNGYSLSAFTTKTKSKPSPPKSPTPPVVVSSPVTGQPARTALKKPNDGTRPKTKEKVRLIEPSEIKRIKAMNKKEKKKKHSHRNLEPVLMTSV